MKNLQFIVKFTATFSVVTATTFSIAQPAKAILLSVADGVTVTSSTSGTDLFSVNNIVDLSGLSGDPNTESNVTHTFFNSSNAWVTRNNGSESSDYYNNFSDPVLTFDLGEDKDLSGFSYWAYQGNGGGVEQGNTAKDISLLFATESDGTSNFGTTITDNPAFTLGIGDTGVEPRQDFNFSTAYTARYVQVTITDNYFGEPGSDGGDRVGMGELLFDGETASASVPFEFSPSLGLVLMGGAFAVSRYAKSRKANKLIDN